MCAFVLYIYVFVLTVLAIQMLQINGATPEVNLHVPRPLSSGLNHRLSLLTTTHPYRCLILLFTFPYSNDANQVSCCSPDLQKTCTK